MNMRFRVLLVLVFALISCAASAQDAAGGGPTPATSADPSLSVIQEVAVPIEHIVMPGVKVSGDGKIVLYVVQIAGDVLEYAPMVNGNRLANKLLDVAKEQRAKTGDTRIPLEESAYRLTMVGELVTSPLWQGVAYSAMTAQAGAVVLVNSLKAPDFAPLFAVSGAYPSWFYSTTAGDSVAYFAQAGDKIHLIADETVALDAGTLPVSAAIIRGKRKVYVVSTAGKYALHVDGKQVGDAHDAIEPALFTKSGDTESAVAYVAKDGDKSILIVGGKMQMTEFAPGHDLAFSPGGDSCVYAAVKSGREFMVRDGARVTKDKDYQQVRWPTFDPTKAKLAYIARDGNREWVMINDKKVTAEYEHVTFCREQYRIDGTLTVAGYDAKKNKIITGRLADTAKSEAATPK